MTRIEPTPTAPRRRNALIIGGVVALAIVAGILSAMVLTRPQAVAGDAPPSPTPVVTPSPSPEPSETPRPEPSQAPSEVPSEEPSEEPEPSQDAGGPQPVVQAPDGVLPPGSIVRVLVESIKIRTGPTTEAMLLDDVVAGDYVMIGWTYLTQGFGPVEAEGFVWYPIIDLGTASLDEVHPPQDAGNIAWMAVGNGSEQWVELAAPRCIEGDPDLAALERMLAWERLACFGDRQITLEGVFGCGGCGGSIPGTFEPYWLASPMYYAFLSIEPQERIGPFVLRFAPDGPAMPDDGTIVRVTGHFDDARSTECVVAPGEPTQAVDPRVQDLYCRSQFVVDGIEVIGVDEDFPFG
jgi:hypothetical protein